MDALNSLEKTLTNIFVTKAPFQLPKSWKVWLGQYAWIFSIIGAIAGGVALLMLLPLLGIVSVIGTAVGGGIYVLFAWIAFAFEILVVVLLALSVSKLRTRQKSGWNLLYYAALVNVIQSIFGTFDSHTFAIFFNLIWTAIFAAIAFYFVFQIREQFTSGSKKSKK